MSEDWTPRFSRGKRIGLGAAGLLVLGAAGGAGAVALTRPTVEMAPTVPTPIAKLADARGVVSVRGHVAEVYGDRFIVQDATGRTLVEVGRDAAGRMHPADAVLVQGHFDDGQLRARYLVDASGEVAEVGPPPPPPHGPGGPPPPPPGLQGPPPPPGGPGVPPLPPGGPGAPPPPTGVTPPAPIAAVAPSAPPPSPEDAAMLPPGRVAPEQR